MLRYGAYRFLNENDDEAQKFCEKDIEELLKTNSHVLTHHTDPNSPHQNLIKMRFESDLADSSLDVTADNFWDKVLKSDQLMKTRKTLETEISALFSQLTKGEIPNFSSKSPDETFFREIEGVVKKFKGLKKPTEKCKNTLKKFLEYAESFKDIFSSKQYCVVKNWADEAYFGKKTAEKGKHSGIVKTSGNEEISKKGKNSLKNGKNSNNQPKNNLKQPRVVKICQKISKIDKKGKFSSQSDCFVCAGKRAKTKKTCEKSKNCTVRNCATRIHEICEEMLKKWFPKFYSKRKAFRCPLHFCSACYLSAKGARLVSCVGCLKSFHGECLPKGFWATGQKDDTKLEGFCAACDRKKKLNK